MPQPVAVAVAKVVDLREMEEGMGSQNGCMLLSFCRGYPVEQEEAVGEAITLAFRIVGLVEEVVAREVKRFVSWNVGLKKGVVVAEEEEAEEMPRGSGSFGSCFSCERIDCERQKKTEVAAAAAEVAEKRKSRSKAKCRYGSSLSCSLSSSSSGRMKR